MNQITHTQTNTSRIISQLMAFVQLGHIKICLALLFVVFSFGTSTSAEAQVTLSGTIFSDAGVTADGAARTINVAVGTSTPSVFSTSSSVTTGTWTVTIPAGHGISTSTPILVWIDNDVTKRGQVLTKSNSSQSAFSITGLDIYRDRVIVRHEAVSGTSTTLADFSFYTAAQDSDLQHSTSTGLLTIAPGNELYIWGGDTFTPGSAVSVLGNASASSTDGSMFLAGSAVYNASGTLTLGGSLRAVSTATFNAGTFTTLFNATTTGKEINAPIASIGAVTFRGSGGAWEFVSSATTTALTILQGSLTAPTSNLTVSGVFQNDATFLHNGGTLALAGAATVALGDIARYVAGLDNSGSAAGNQNLQISTMAVSGNFLYIGKAGNATACSQTAGSAIGCELMVFDISSTTNPIYRAGRDVSGNAAGTGNLAVNNIIIFGNYLYVGKATNGTACSNTAGSAIGCELMVFDISSTTNPVYVVGRDASGSAAGTDATTAITNFATSTNALYVSKSGSATACSNTAGSAAGCELMMFDISSTTNPVYIVGRDVSGNAAGTGNLTINQIMALGTRLYTIKLGNGTACSNTAGSATGCELMVFDISSTTNPVYSVGRDVSGSAAGTGNLSISALMAVPGFLYVGKAGSATACSQTAGSAVGCELMVFDISSTTNPVYVRGVDVAGSVVGEQTLAINNITISNNYLYAVNAASAIPCSQFTGLALGCELLVFDISSSTAVRLLSGRDAGGDSVGVQSLGATALVAQGANLYVAKAGSATACSQTAGSAVGCELMVFDISRSAQGVVMGDVVGSSALNNVTATGLVEFRDNASTTDLTITSGTTTAPQILTLAGDYQNNASFVNHEGTLIFASTSDQTLSGNLASTSALYRVQFSGAGTKTLTSNASTTFMDIATGVTVVAPNTLTISDAFTNNGTFSNNGGTIQTVGFLNEFLAGMSAGGSANDTQGLVFSAFAQKNNILYVAKAGSATACSQVAGSAIGCELMAFDISSTTNPIYRAGRDASGNAAGTGNLAITQLHVSGNYLYVSKAGNATACSNTAGSALGCELMVFDISSTTNPIYVVGRDASGSAAGTGAIAMNQLVATSSALYVVKAGDATACSQTAGSAVGCELMVFDISSTTNPIYVAGRDADGGATGTQTLSAPSLTVFLDRLYVAKSANATACSQTAGSAVGCELMVFDISSTTNPIYVAGRDGTGSAAGTGSLVVQFIYADNNLLHVTKAGSATACSQTAGSATGCEYMIFNIASSTNPLYIAGRDVLGSAAGTGSVTANMVVATGTTAYIAKFGNSTTCSQVVGSALGCELMVFDISSTTNPQYVQGRDSDSSLDGRSAVTTQAVFLSGEKLVVGKAADTIVCAQVAFERTGCELALYKIPTTLGGNLTDASALATVTTNGLTTFTASASTTNLIIASSSQVTAPSDTLSIAGDLTIKGNFIHNNGNVELLGTSNRVAASATTTFYDFTQRATTTASTTFSTAAPFVIVRNLTLTGQDHTKILSLYSVTEGSQWKIDPRSTTTITFAYLGVKDSNNVSQATTTLVCPTYCIDYGENTNWYFAQFTPLITISGRLFAADGVTPITSGKTLKMVIGTSTPTEYTTVTDGSGDYSFADISRNSLGVFATTSNHGSAANFEDIVYGDGLFVAVGADTGSRVMTSIDGVTWTAQSIPDPTFNARSVTYSEYHDRFVVVGDKGIITSSDAVTWTEVVGVGNDGWFNDVATANNSDPLFVAVGDCTGTSGSFTECVVYSTDGLTWATTTAAGNDDWWQGLAEIEGTFVAVSGYQSEAGESVMYSDDGITWTTVSALGDDDDWKDLVSLYPYGFGLGATYLVAVANATHTDSMMISEDLGVTWTAIPAPHGADSIAYGNGTLVATQDCTLLSKDECTMISNDLAQSWQSIMMSATSSLNTVGYGANQFVMQTKGEAQGWYADAGFGDDTSVVVYIDNDTSDAALIFNGLNVLDPSALLSESDLVVGAVRSQPISYLEWGLADSVLNSTLQARFDRVDDSDVLFTATKDDLTIHGDFIVYRSKLIVQDNLILEGDVDIDNGFFLPLNINATTTFSATAPVVVDFVRTDPEINPLSFGNLVIESTAGNGSSTPAVTFNTQIQSDGIFTMAPSSSAAFMAGATSTFNAVNWVGSSAASPVWLRSTTPGVPWGLTITGTKNIQYVNVKDSNATTTVGGVTANDSVNSGGNTNWSFVSVGVGTGSSSIAAHTAGQISNRFTSQNATNESLIAFRIIPTSGSTTINSVTFNLTGAVNINPLDFSNIRLFVDTDNDGVYDASDIQVGGTGVMSLGSNSGTIAFTSSFVATTTRDYIVVADFNAPQNGSFLTITLNASGVVSVDGTGVQTIFGSAQFVRHSRNNKGGGGGSTSSVGGAAPAGDGDVGGGVTTGGELIGSSPDFFWPTSNSGSWSNGADAYDQTDGTYATTDSIANHNYINHGFGVPTGNTVSGIEVRLELSGSTAAGTVDVQLSWDGGTTWTSTKSTPTLTTADSVRTLGSPSDQWGRTWVADELSNANFAVRLIGNPGSNTVRVDAIQVRVYHTTGGGGAGGGAGGGGI